MSIWPVFWYVLLVVLLVEAAGRDLKHASKSSKEDKKLLQSRYPFLKRYVPSKDAKSIMKAKNRGSKRILKRNVDKAEDLDRLRKALEELTTSLKKGNTVKRRHAITQRKVTAGNNEEVTARTNGFACTCGSDIKHVDMRLLIDAIKQIASERNAKASESSPKLEKAIAKFRKDVEASGTEYTTESRFAEEGESLDGLRNGPVQLLNNAPRLYGSSSDSTTTPSTTTALYDAYSEYAPQNIPLAENNGMNDKEVVRSADGEHETIMKILMDVEELKGARSLGSGPKNDLPCDLRGSWSSQVGGKVLSICESPDRVLRVTLQDSIPAKEGFLNEPTWNFNGSDPFPRSGLILIWGINESCKQAATFIGECKIYEGKETISGQWLIGKLARDCLERQSSQDVIGDVWKRETLHKLRKKRLKIKR